VPERYARGNNLLLTMPPHPLPAQPAVPDTEPWPLPWLRSLGFRYLLILDTFGLYALMALISTTRFGTTWPTYSTGYYLVGFAATTFIHLGVYYFGGLYEYEQRLGRPAWLPRASALSLMAVLLSAFIAFTTGRYFMPRGNLLAFLVGSSLLVTFNRWLSRSVRSRRFGNPRVLLVGQSADRLLATTHLEESGGDIEIVGQVAPGGDLIEEIDLVGATDVLLLSGETLDGIYPQPLGQLGQRRIGVFKRITPADTLMGLQRSRQIAGMPFVGLRAHALPVCELRLKRLLDLFYFTLALPLALPIFVLTAAYVRVRAGAGIFYRQQRVGFLGKPFAMWKFRTMAHGVESTTGAQLATAADPRVLAGMTWIRRARLDELPQLWNVIKGEMSLVGPRPERPKFVEQFESEIPGYERRHDVPPGLTGLAQVQGHYQTDPSYKLGHDLQYIVNWSAILDLQIGLKTVLVVLRRSAR
jgi:exopolysaccharide biosynthesis polyprenyl glycosylphosphotransferase